MIKKHPAKCRHPSKPCPGCKKLRRVTSFTRDRTRKGGRGKKCKFCVSAKRRANIVAVRLADRLSSKRSWDRKPVERAFQIARTRARAAGLKFTLTVADLRELFAGAHCVYCNRKVSVRSLDYPDRASIDKLIPRFGYTKKNTVLACCNCNRKKGNSSVRELVHFAVVINRILAARRS